MGGLTCSYAAQQVRTHAGCDTGVASSSAQKHSEDRRACSVRQWVAYVERHPDLRLFAECSLVARTIRRGESTVLLPTYTLCTTVVLRSRVEPTAEAPPRRNRRLQRSRETSLTTNRKSTFVTARMHPRSFCNRLQRFPPSREVRPLTWRELRPWQGRQSAKLSPYIASK